MSPTRRTRRLSWDSRFSGLVDAWLFDLGATKPASNTIDAYRGDVTGVARESALTKRSCTSRIYPKGLTRGLLLVGVRSRRSLGPAAYSSWSIFFDFLGAEDLLEGNPMAAVARPKRQRQAPRSIRDPDAAVRLLAIRRFPATAGAATRGRRETSPSSSCSV